MLPRAADGTEFHEIDGKFRGEAWSVRLTAIASLEIGRVWLEHHRVEIEFDGLTAEEQDRFMPRFTLHYWRGGG